MLFHLLKFVFTIDKSDYLGKVLKWTCLFQLGNDFEIVWEVSIETLEVRFYQFLIKKLSLFLAHSTSDFEYLGNGILILILKFLGDGQNILS